MVGTMRRKSVTVVPSELTLAGDRNCSGASGAWGRVLLERGAQRGDVVVVGAQVLDDQAVGGVGPLLEGGERGGLVVVGGRDPGQALEALRVGGVVGDVVAGHGAADHRDVRGVGEPAHRLLVVGDAVRDAHHGPQVVLRRVRHGPQLAYHGLPFGAVDAGVGEHQADRRPGAVVAVVGAVLREVGALYLVQGAQPHVGVGGGEGQEEGEGDVGVAGGDLVLVPDAGEDLRLVLGEDVRPVGDADALVVRAALGDAGAAAGRVGAEGGPQRPRGAPGEQHTGGEEQQPDHPAGRTQTHSAWPPWRAGPLRGEGIGSPGARVQPFSALGHSVCAVK
jgi:hypothetical protein